MILVYKPLNISIDIDSSSFNEIQIERQDLFREMISSLWSQFENGDGEILLYEKEKEYSVNKIIDVIVNPFAISCNSKKILNVLYREMEEIDTDRFFEQYEELNSKVIKHLEDVADELPYPITYDLEIKKTALYNLYGVKLQEEETDFLDRIVSYIKIMHRICGLKYFAFVNLRDYFSDSQISNLIKECTYEEISLIDFESVSESDAVDYGNTIIIDKDLCIIRSA